MKYYAACSPIIDFFMNNMDPMYLIKPPCKAVDENTGFLAFASQEDITDCYLQL
jgi:hypothetical protein